MARVKTQNSFGALHDIVYFIGQVSAAIVLELLMEDGSKVLLSITNPKLHMFYAENLPSCFFVKLAPIYVGFIHASNPL